MTESLNQLTKIEELADLIKTNQIVANKPLKNEHGGQKISFERKFPNGKKGPLLLASPSCFSYGLSENTDKKSGEVTGYSMCFILHDSNGATPEQLAFINALEALYQFSLDAVVKHKIALGKAHINKTNATGLVKNPVYKVMLEGEDDEGNPIPDTSKPPKVYTKLMTSYEDVRPGDASTTPRRTFKKKVKKDGIETEVPVDKKLVVTTTLYDSSGADIDALGQLKDNRCTVEAGVVSIDGLYSGQAISMQLKLTEAQVRPHERKSGTSLLRRPTQSAPKPDADVHVVITGDDDGDATKQESADDLLDE